LVYVDLSRERARLQFWFDPACNHLVRRLRMDEPGSAPAEWQVHNFQEAAPGIYFPAKIEWRWGPHSSRAEFSNAQINRPLPPDVFQFRFPEGVLVWDLVRHQVLITNKQGVPMYRPRDEFGNVLVMDDRGALRPVTTLGYARVLWQELNTVTPWLLPASLSCLALAACWSLARKLHRRRKSSCRPSSQVDSVPP
jgi:hypothetical protein